MSRPTHGEGGMKCVTDLAGMCGAGKQTTANKPPHCDAVLKKSAYGPIIATGETR